MIFLIHRNASEFLRAIKNEEEIALKSSSLTSAFWELAENYPEDLIVWCEEEFFDRIEMNKIANVFPYKNNMVSLAVKSGFLSAKIGYIDQLPFVNPNPKVRYATWLMSSDIGGVFGETALPFKKKFNKISNFEYLINSIAKLGQQNSLFCYSDPAIIMAEQRSEIKFRAGNRDLFNFVAQHYKREWLWVLLFCLYRYEKVLPLFSFFKSFFQESFFQKEILFPEINESGELEKEEKTVDVIIPTLGRPEMLKQVLTDLSNQSKLPSTVIIVEQNPDLNSHSEIQFSENDFPFKIRHHFIHTIGACYARNLALKEVTSNWIFFADDDIRLPAGLLKDCFNELEKLKVNALHLNSLRPGEKIAFKKIKQWGAFGSGTSIVNSKYALQCRFSEVLEFGFGEDIDYGMQLREKGCDIIYHPELKFTHLKAERGGFRATGINDWSNHEIEPKPSPTMMFLARKYYTSQMIKGYKVSLFLKFYRKQSIKNPFRYFGMMRKRWNRSEELCNELQANKVS